MLSCEASAFGLLLEPIYRRALIGAIPERHSFGARLNLGEAMGLELW